MSIVSEPVLESSLRSKLILLDFDGVISLETYVPQKNWRSSGEDSYENNYKDTKNVTIVYEDGHEGSVLYRPSVIARLNKLIESGLEIKWLTDRGQYASELLAPAIGLVGVTRQDSDAFSLGTLQQYDGGESIYWYKYKALVREVLERNRQVLFIDDRIISDVNHYLGYILNPNEVSLIQTNSLRGLTDTLMNQVELWAAEGDVIRVSNGGT